MPLEIWENVLQIGRAYKPNQPTECPIQTSTPTIDIYSNILPTNNPPTSTPQQQLVPHNPMMFNTGMFPPHMMYGNNNAFMMGQQPLLYNQPNYVNVMAAAQSIVNAAAAYNNMYNPAYNQPTTQQQQLISSQPHHQQILSPQQQHQQPQIKRKPVQLQPTQYISPQIEQRLLRKKTIPQQQQQVQQPVQPPPRIKKSVRFADKPIIHTYEALEEEYDLEEEVPVDDHHQQQGGGDGYYEDEDDGYYDQQQHYYPEDEVEQHRHHHHDAYYTQQPPPYNNYSSNSNRYPPPITRPWSANSGGRQYYYDDNEEEDHGELWQRRNFITRHNSMGGSSNKNKPRV